MVDFLTTNSSFISLPAWSKRPLGPFARKRHACETQLLIVEKKSNL
jgi:hypothetical protein